MFIETLFGDIDLSFFADYKENMFLITFFLITYYTIKTFFYKDTITIEEKMTRQKIAEEYLNKHLEEDNDFFYGALSETSTNS